ADRNRSHWSTSKTPSYTKSVSWQHHHSVGIGTGLELGHFQFMFGYDYPLSNSSKDPDLSQVRQHNFRASIAYSFRKLKK
ncbi:hypothetical protein RZR40_25550, partial [Escherichia coli]